LQVDPNFKKKRWSAWHPRTGVRVRSNRHIIGKERLGPREAPGIKKKKEKRKN
jgi:hypothetical protein